VDPDSRRARALASGLRSRGCYVASALSGEEALRYTAENEPDAILAEWDLPDLAGPEFARRVRIAGFAATVALLREGADWLHLRRTMECGGDDLLGRPCTLDQVVRSLCRCAQAAARFRGARLAASGA
jgi:DNA-binding response OmpR family regulator